MLYTLLSLALLLGSLSTTGTQSQKSATTTTIVTPLDNSGPMPLCNPATQQCKLGY